MPGFLKAFFMMVLYTLDVQVNFVIFLPIVFSVPPENCYCFPVRMTFGMIVLSITMSLGTPSNFSDIWQKGNGLKEKMFSQFL